MYYDTLTLAALRDELSDRLLGGRVQRIVRPCDLVLGLEIYAGQRFQLLLSAEPQRPAVLLVDEKLRRGTESPSPLQLLLRKHVRGARLQAIEQPPLERILRFTFHGAQGPVDLICEIMGRLSNVILVGPDNVIMESMKRIPASINRYRTILPTYPYVAPPAQDKEHPLLLTTTLLRRVLAEEPTEPLWRRLLNAVLGSSPLLAREIVYRATGEIAPSFPLEERHYARLITTTAELLRLPDTHAWSPCLAYEREGADSRPVAYAPYELTHLSDHEPVASMSIAINRLRQAQRLVDPYKKARERLCDIIDDQVRRQEARLASLRRSQISEAEIEAVQHKASAILAVAWAIKPGQTEVRVDPSQPALDPNGLSEGSQCIPLDPLLSPSENAQKLFRQYRKMKAAAQQVPSLIVEGERELAYLSQLLADVDLAEDRPQLDDVERELREAGYLSDRAKKRESKSKSEPISLRGQDGTPILVGRNSRQNEEVTFHRGAPDDIWLHAHGVPGSHVIVKCGGEAVEEDTLLLAARLAAYYSAARHQGRVQVDFTERRHVRRLRGGRPGMVTYTHEKTLVVAPKIDHE